MTCKLYNGITDEGARVQFLEGLMFKSFGSVVLESNSVKSSCIAPLLLLSTTSYIYIHLHLHPHLKFEGPGVWWMLVRSPSVLYNLTIKFKFNVARPWFICDIMSPTCGHSACITCGSSHIHADNQPTCDLRHPSRQ